MASYRRFTRYRMLGVILGVRTKYNGEEGRARHGTEEDTEIVYVCRSVNSSTTVRNTGRRRHAVLDDHAHLKGITSEPSTGAIRTHVSQPDGL